MATPPCASQRALRRRPPGAGRRARACAFPPSELREARDRLPRDLRARPRADGRATSSASTPSRCRPPSSGWRSSPGIEVGRVWRGLDRVAAYVPGGTAAYPSSLLMSAIPARLAGVGSYVVASPAGRRRRALPGPAGCRRPHGGRRVLGHGRRPGRRRAGLRHGVDPRAWTRSWAPATPGSRRPSWRCWTAAPSTCRPARRRSWSSPTTTADPVHVAADLLSQAEHGADSPALLVTPSEAPGRRRRGRAGAASCRRWPRRETLAASLAAAGTVVLTADVAEALAFADEYAPEHLSCRGRRRSTPRSRSLRHAGSLFLGAYAPESAGDYAAGSNHVLPTAGAGRAYSAAGGRVVRALDAGQPHHAATASRASARPWPPSPRPRASRRTGAPSRSASRARR